MIIGEALKRLFKDLSYGYLDKDSVKQTEAVQFHYGDHKELIKWLTISDSENLPKYPLLWYVVNPYTEEDNTGFKNVNSKLIILHTFRNRKDYLNNIISQKTYDNVIEPVWIATKKLLNSSPAVQVIGEQNRKYTIKDEPNYGVKTDGVRTSQTDFTTKQKQGEQSISIDLVDGRIIELNLRIKTNCI